VYPVLHGKISLMNGALDSFYDFLDDKVEALTDGERMTRSDTMVAGHLIALLISLFQLMLSMELICSHIGWKRPT